MNSGLVITLELPDGSWDHIDILESSFNMSYQIADMVDFGKGESDKSLPISAPKTDRNNRLFGHLHDISVANTLPGKKLRARISYHGQEVLRNGYYQVRRTAKAYELLFSGGNFSLFDAVKDVSLRDLDYSEFGHFWTLQAVYDARNNTTGYTYPIIDNFSDSPNTIIDDIDRVIRVDYLYPAVFVSTILDKIAQLAGVQITGDVFESDEFNKLALAFSNDQFLGGDDGSIYLGSFQFQQAVNFTGPNYLPQDLNYLSGNVYWNNAPGALFENYFEFRDDVTVKVVMKLNVVNTSGSAQDIIIRKTYNSGIANTVEYDQIAVPPTSPSGTTVTYTVNVSTRRGISNQSFIEFAFRITNIDVGILQTSTIEIAECTIDAAGITQFSTTPSANSYVSLSGALPDMSCSDLLEALQQHFGLIFQYDPLTNAVRAERWAKVHENKAKPLTWANRIDESTIEVEYTTGSYGQKNKVLLDNPDEMDPLKGALLFSIPNEHLPEEKEVYQFPWPYIENVQRLDGLVIPQTPILNEDFELTGDDKPHLLIINQETISPGLDYYDSVSTLTATTIPMAYFSLAGKPYNLDVASVASRWWQERIYMLQKGRMITCKMLLGATDVATLDMMRPIYHPLWGKYYIINKIEDWAEHVPARCELIEL